MVASLRDGDVGMLENVRFEPGEEANDPAFARQLAAFGDVFVNDAFGTAHRAHASTEGVAHLLPAVAGKLMARELEMLGGVMDNPRSAGGRHRRRLEDLDQGRRARPSARSRRRALGRRCDGVHLLPRARREHRDLAGRGGAGRRPRAACSRKPADGAPTSAFPSMPWSSKRPSPARRPRSSRGRRSPTDGWWSTQALTRCSALPPTAPARGPSSGTVRSGSTRSLTSRRHTRCRACGRRLQGDHGDRRRRPRRRGPGCRRC